MKFVLNNSKAGKGAQDFLQKSLIKNQKKFLDTENQLKKQESDLLGQKNVLSKEEYKAKTDELRNKVLIYQKDRKTTLGKIAKQRTDARQRLIKEIDPILNTYIKENDISLIVVKKSIIGGNTDLDITNIIVEKLNKKLPSLNLK